MGYSEHLTISISGFRPEMGLETALKGAEVVDLSALEGDIPHCGAAKAEAVRIALAAKPLSAIHWIDSGDGHYISSFWLERVGEPFALLLLDHSPDMRQPVEGRISSNDWVRQALASRDKLKQVLMLGIDPDLELEILDFVFNGVLAVTDEDLRHCGNHLSTDVTEMISLLEPRIPVYVSIDKSVLSPEYARDGRGFMTPGQMKAILALVARSHRIIGVDICGGFDHDTDSALASFLESL